MEARRKRDVSLILLAAALAAVAGAFYLYSNLYYADGFLTMPLDDAYIFFHYARNFAAGHPLAYNVGDPPTTGVTSYLYLLMLTPLALVFQAPNALVWAAYVLNVALYGLSIWLFAKVVSHLFEGRYVIVSTFVYATTGVVTFHALGGMDSGLYVAALLFALYTYILYQDQGRRVWFIAALATLTVARPEGIIAAALLAALALLGRGPKNESGGGSRPRSKWLLLLGLTPIPVYFAVNYFVGGHLSSMSFLSKSILAPSTRPWADRAVAILSYTVYAVKSVFAGLDGQYLRAFYNANTLQAAANYFAPLALAFFLVGWGRAARKSWSEGRALPGFAAGVVFLACVTASCLALPYPRHYARYIVPYFPLFVIGVLGGIDGLAFLIRYGRPQISHAAMFWTGAAYFLVFGLISSAYFCVVYGMSARDIRYQHVAVARYIRENVPAGAAIFTHDVGALAYYGGRKIVDLEGLVTRDAWRYGHEGTGAVAEFAGRRLKYGDYFVGYFSEYALEDTGALEPTAYSVRLLTTTMAGGREMSVARFAAEVFEQPPLPDSSFLADFELADEVDVADLASEAAHGYRLRRRGANMLPSFAAAHPLRGAPGVNIFEAGRSVCGGEEFTVDVPPGRDVVAVVRCEPPYRASVRVNGVFAGKWEVPPAKGDFYRDGYFPIRAQFIRGPRLRVALETLSDDLTSNSPVHYYFYSRKE
ncbi:MAG: hypothetical protein V3W11_13135 [bacterium]